MIEQTGARADVEAAIEDLAATSRRTLLSLPLCRPAVEALAAMADYVRSATGDDRKGGWRITR